jgi:integral membrane protein
MPLAPRAADIPRIRKALKVYKVSSIITGSFLLLLVTMMVLRYIFLVDIELNGPEGFLALTYKENIVGINLSIVILSVHGWLYVLYLGTDFVLWRLVGYSFGRFLFIALGGIIPLLSYFFESRVPKMVEARIAEVEARTGATTDAAVSA